MNIIGPEFRDIYGRTHSEIDEETAMPKTPKESRYVGTAKMPTPPDSPSREASRAEPASGIFGPDWHKWRGATLVVGLANQEPFTARLDDVSGGPDKMASLSVLDALGRPTSIRTIDWPPKGSVRIVRAP